MARSSGVPLWLMALMGTPQVPWYARMAAPRLTAAEHWVAGALSQHGPWLEAWNGRHERKQTLTVVISSSAALRGPVKECVPLIDGQDGAVEIDFALFQGGAPMLEAAGLLQHDVVCSVAGEPTRDFKAEGVKQLISVQQEPCEVGLLRRFAIQYDLMGFVVRHTVDGVRS